MSPFGVSMIVVSFQITTATGGAYTSSTSTVTGQPASGAYLLEAVEWIDGTLADGVDFVLSSINPSGVDRILLDVDDANNDAWYQPRIYGNNPATGATWANGADVTAAYTQLVVTGTLKLAVTSGGDDKTGKCLVYLKKC
jgi:hypothetical protein